MCFHPLGNAQVFRTVIPADATWNTKASRGFQEKTQHCIGPIVGVDAGAGDEAGRAIDESMVDEFPTDEACIMVVREMKSKEGKGKTNHVDRRGAIVSWDRVHDTSSEQHDGCRIQEGHHERGDMTRECASQEHDGLGQLMCLQS